MNLLHFWCHWPQHFIRSRPSPFQHACKAWKKLSYFTNRIKGLELLFSILSWQCWVLLWSVSKFDQFQICGGSRLDSKPYVFPLRGIQLRELVMKFKKCMKWVGSSWGEVWDPKYVHLAIQQKKFLFLLCYLYCVICIITYFNVKL